MVTDKKNEKRQIRLIPFNDKYNVFKMFFFFLIQLNQINTTYCEFVLAIVFVCSKGILPEK